MEMSERFLTSNPMFIKSEHCLDQKILQWEEASLWKKKLRWRDNKDGYRNREREKKTSLFQLDKGTWFVPSASWFSTSTTHVQNNNSDGEKLVENVPKHVPHTHRLTCVTPNIRCTTCMTPFKYETTSRVEMPGVAWHRFLSLSLCLTASFIYTQ